jgi:hypothetical protein
VDSKVARWRALDDRQRARGEVGFDPVVAQAEGLLTRRVLAGVHTWGKLPPTVHVRRLVETGMIAREEVAWPARTTARTTGRSTVKAAMPARDPGVDG